MLKAWFKGYLAEIFSLRDCLDNAKTTLNVVLWPCCGKLCELFCELYVICPKKCLGTVWIEKINPNTGNGIGVLIINLQQVFLKWIFVMGFNSKLVQEQGSIALDSS